jgi:hypothetical protein
VSACTERIHTPHGRRWQLKIMRSASAPLVLVLLAAALTLAAVDVGGIHGSRACRPSASDPYACIPHLTVPSTPPPAFGHDMLPLFSMAPTYRNFNSGSFGGECAID